MSVRCMSDVNADLRPSFNIFLIQKIESYRFINTSHNLLINSKSHGKRNNATVTMETNAVHGLGHNVMPFSLISISFPNIYPISKI